MVYEHDDCGYDNDRIEFVSPKMWRDGVWSIIWLALDNFAFLLRWDWWGMMQCNGSTEVRANSTIYKRETRVFFSNWARSTAFVTCPSVRIAYLPRVLYVLLYNTCVGVSSAWHDSWVLYEMSCPSKIVEVKSKKQNAMFYDVMDRLCCLTWFTWPSVVYLSSFEIDVAIACPKSSDIVLVAGTA